MAVDFSNLSLSQIVIAFIIVGIILKILSEFTDMILSKLNIYHKKRNDDEKITEKIAAHEKKIEELCEKCSGMTDYLDLVKEIEVRQLRNTLTRSCMDALRRGSISYFELESLGELFEMYETPAPNGLGGNHYVHDLVNRVKKLPVVD